MNMQKFEDDEARLKKNAKLVRPYLSKNNVDLNLLFFCKLLPPR